jgi:hypothetical protein
MGAMKKRERSFEGSPRQLQANRVAQEHRGVMGRKPGRPPANVPPNRRVECELIRWRQD